MKAITLVIGFLFLSVSAQAKIPWSYDCDFINTGGKKITTAYGRITGGQAQATLLIMHRDDKLPLQNVKDEAGVERYQKVEMIGETRTYSTARPDCNDHYTAKLSQVCTKSIQDSLTKKDPTTTCIFICEQSSYSDDCR